MNLQEINNSNMELEKIFGKCITDYQQFLTLDIENEDQRNLLTKKLKDIKGFLKSLEAKRKEIVKPLNDYIKKWNNTFKPIINELTEYKENFQEKIIEYTEKQDFIEDKETTSIETDYLKTSIMNKVDFEIINESLIPRAYLIPNDKKIRAVIKEGIEIPGIKKVIKPFLRQV